MSTRHAWTRAPHGHERLLVGWFPLGPREVWVPSYRVSAVYMTRVNVSNTVVTEVAIRNAGVGAVYANRGAIVAVRGDAFAGGRHIDAAVAVRVPPGVAERAEIMHAAPGAPERAAVLGGRAPLAGAHQPPAAVMNRPVVSRMTPPAAAHANIRPANGVVNAGHVEAAAPPANRPNVTPRPETASSSHEERAPQKKTSKPAKKTTRSEKDR